MGGRHPCLPQYNKVITTRLSGFSFNSEPDLFAYNQGENDEEVCFLLNFADFFISDKLYFFHFSSYLH